MLRINLKVDFKIIFLAFIVLLAVWRVKKGFKNGMVKEIISILSIIVALACVTLIFWAVSSAVAHTFSTLMVCMAGLIVIGVIYKLCHLILKPLTAILDISLIHGLDKMLGAVMGFGEAVICAYFLYRVLDYFGIYTLSLASLPINL